MGSMDDATTEIAAMLAAPNGGFGLPDAVAQSIADSAVMRAVATGFLVPADELEAVGHVNTTDRESVVHWWGAKCTTEGCVRVYRRLAS